MSDLREKVAEELWQAEWARVNDGKRRRVPWFEIAPSDHEKWRHFADAAIAVCMEEAAAWHEKNARVCREIAEDDPRVGADARAKAKIAASHHAASATGLRQIANYRSRAAALRALRGEGGVDG